jgi:Zn-dependent protease
VQNIENTIYFVVGLLIAVDLHEYAHAWLATRFGDQTPRAMGRLTLNPKPLVDPFGTLVLPAILLLPMLLAGKLLWIPFAYAKQMPLNPWNLRRKDADAIWIAVAGILANVALAFVFGALLRVANTGQLALFLIRCLQVNVAMAGFHIVPIPGLDGGRVVARFLSGHAKDVFLNLEQYLALFMLVVLFIFGGPILSFVGLIGNGICNLAAGFSCI